MSAAPHLPNKDQLAMDRTFGRMFAVSELRSISIPLLKFSRGLSAHSDL